MSTNCVFDPKFNIVAVDPDSNAVIQIPGTEFQAETSSDSYEKIALYPNYFPGKNNHGPNPETPPRPGEYVLGVGIENRNRYGITWYVGERSCMFRVAHPHIISPESQDCYVYLVNSQYDKYIEHTDFVTYYERGYTTSDRGYVRFKWQEMLDDGLSLPTADGTVLSFNVEIYRAWDPEPVVVPDGETLPVPVQSGPYNSPIIIPVRVQIDELNAAGRP